MNEIEEIDRWAWWTVSTRPNPVHVTTMPELRTSGAAFSVPARPSTRCQRRPACLVFILINNMSRCGRHVASFASACGRTFHQG